MEFRILGPLEVVEHGNPIALGNLKERLVLTVLLLHANEFVSRERLIDDLWGDAPPPTARQAVNVYLSKLRKTLSQSGPDPIATTSGGYRLQIEPDSLDATRAQRLFEQAREHISRGEAGVAGELLREALSLWRGPTLAGLQLEARGGAEVAALDELRLTALMDRIDCDLALDRHDEVLGELSVLVREHRLRERFRAQQMLALYRASRQADALAAYAEARKTLVDELGIEPSEALQRLQQAILRHDRSLETSAGTATLTRPAAGAHAPLPAAPDTDDDAGRTRSHASRRRWPFIAAAAVILAGAAAATATLMGSGAAAPRVVAESLVQIDPQTGRIVSDEPLHVDPTGFFAVTPKAIWTVDYAAGATGTNAGTNISRYDLRTHRVQSLDGNDGPREPFGLVVDARGNVWVSSLGGDITRLAFRRSRNQAGPLHHSHAYDIRIPYPGAAALAFGSGYVWAIPGPITTHGYDDRVWVIDPTTNRLARQLSIGHETTAVTFGDGAAWIAGFATERYLGHAPSVMSSTSYLTAVRAAAARPRSYPLEGNDTGGPLAVAFGDGKVWVLPRGPAGTVDQNLLEFDPKQGHVVNSIPLGGRRASSVAVGAGYVWITNQVDASVTQVDPKTGRIVRTIPVGEPRTAPTCGIAATRTAVWVTVGARASDCVFDGP